MRYLHYELFKEMGNYYFPMEETCIVEDSHITLSTNVNWKCCVNSNTIKAAQRTNLSEFLLACQRKEKY